MKRLFIFRHGESFDGKFLTDAGRAQNARLGQILNERHGLGPENTEVICSTKLSAIRTAYGLCLAIGLKPDHFGRRDMERDELLSTDSVCDIQGALRVLAEYQDETEVLVIVTHYEMVRDLPSEFVTRVLGARGILSYYSFEYGQGCLIDCEKLTCERIES